MGKAIRESSIGTRLGESSKLGMLIRKPKIRTILVRVYVDDIKLAGKKHNIDPMWKVLMKEVGLGEPTSFLDHCTQRKCQTSKDIVDKNINV